MASPTSTAADALDRHFRTAVSALPSPEPVEACPDLAEWGQGASTSSAHGTGSAHGTPESALAAIFDAQLGSRHLDLIARELQSEGEGFYTIGSAGHESNAAIAYALRPDDPALLHYRSGGFYLARGAQHPGSTPITDILQGLMSLADEPIAGGRHKVFGNKALHVIPQTSTIASHLPRAVGLAISLDRAHRLARRHGPALEPEWPQDAVVACSFGDASANHSAAAGAINTALNATYRGLGVPILFVCEDNGYGISVPTPAGWIEHAYGSRPGLDYLSCDGSDVDQVLRTAAEAADRVRRGRRPVFLHLRCVRFLAHAGSDAEISYRSSRQIQADYARDPLLGTARALVDHGWTPDQVLARYHAGREAIDTEVVRLRGGRRLESAAEVMAPLAPRHPDRIAERAHRLATTRAELVEAPTTTGPHSTSSGQASTSSGHETSGSSRPGSTLAESINATLDAIMAAEPRALIFGEDVGVKGGVYGVTGGMARKHGSARVFDSILDEQSILGLALGAGLTGLLPIPEVQYLAYLHNAIDQLRGEAATQQFFSGGRYRNPMVLRLPGLAYQKGFGGHFHNDNAIASLRDIPGVVVGCPSVGDDAAAMLRTLVAAGLADGTVSVLLEPIALYHRRDLHPGDGAWLSVDAGDAAEIGTARRHRSGADLTMITFGNGVPMCLQVADRLQTQGIDAAVLDLRWLSPLPTRDILTAAEETGRALVVDETRHAAGVGEGVITALIEAGYRGAIARVASEDSFIPLGRAADHVLLGPEQIEKAAIELTGRTGTPARRYRT